MPSHRSPYEIDLHHVGAFGGNLPLHIPGRLRGDVNVFFYDADSRATECLGNDNGFRRQVNFGKAVADRDGEVEIRLEYHPAGSSLLTPAADFAKYWRDSAVETSLCDVVMADHREERRVRVPATTIDAICASEGVEADILSIDAEGAEALILDGAAGVTERSVVGLICEVHFNQYRQGQPSVGDLFGLAERRQFHLSDMHLHEGRAFRRQPIGWRSNGCLVSGDLVFSKRLDAIRQRERPAVGLLKLAFFSLLTGRMEYAVAALDDAVAVDPQVLRAGEDFAYVRLAAEMLALYREEAALYPPLWADFYPTAEAGLRHSAPDLGIDTKVACRNYFRRTGAGTFMRRIEQLWERQDSPVEALLRGYELASLADTVKSRRLQSVGNLLTRLGLIEGNTATSISVARRIAEKLSG